MRELQRNQTSKPHNEIMGMSDKEKNQTRDSDKREPIQFHAWKISKTIRETVSWCMLFADDIVLVAETKEEVKNELEEWREVLESKGLRISLTKAEYLRCDFSGIPPNGEPEVSTGEEVVTSTAKYRYLGLIFQSSVEIVGDVTHQIQAGWLKWRVAIEVLCDRKFPSRLKGKFYRMAIRPALLYGTECWPVKKTLEHKMKVTEMRMLRWMCGHTLLDQIRNQEFRKKLGVAPISAKIG
ncbi:uncharacterized protein LOC130818636 [Amaranthus tricolor]|uniref:uncharacterized protein LOC130818636 n=1 Tax=Amaranthus tricolor TaxID=29722 RepID=UPI0025862E40|nr:uncharacterized protein LOC130818636 [Amaranthus tricolor]